jgi:hypothetical protein
MSEQHDAAHTGRVEAHRLDGFIDAAFACSFATLMIFWHRHVRWRDRFRLHDSVSMLLSLMLVFFALIFVYPLNMLFQAMFSALYEAFAHRALSGAPTLSSMHDLKALYLCYGMAYACMAGCLVCLYAHSLRRAHLSHVERIDAQEVSYTQSGSVCVAALSLLAALSIPEATSRSAVPGLVYAWLTPVYWMAGKWARQKKVRTA